MNSLYQASSVVSAAEESTQTVGTPWINMSIFGAFVLVTMIVVLRASKNNKTAADYYAGGRSFSGTQNGLAIAGDYLSAASFLGIVGAIALQGYDGFLYSIGFLVAWLVALLLVAEPLRNTGKFTMADVLSFRLRQRPVRIAACISTLAVTFFYLLAQMAGAGALVSLLMGISSKAGQSLVIVIVGVLMILYVLIGGMKGTTWVQIIKACLLIAGVAVMTIWILGIYGFNFSSLLGGAVEASGNSRILEPGLKYGKSEVSKLDFISLGLALVFGAAGLPHVLMRFYTVPTAKEARKSVVWAISLIGLFYPLYPGTGIWCGGSSGSGRNQGGSRWGKLRSSSAGFSSRWLGSHGRYCGSCFRNHSCGGCWSGYHRIGIICPRYLHQRYLPGKERSQERNQGC